MVADSFIQEALARWPEWPIERAIFRTDDAAGITTQLDALCREHLGQGLAKCFHHSSTFGVVFGLRLGDDRRVAVKCHHPDWESLDRLVAIRGAQTALVDAGFPTARPLVGPVAVGRAWATVDEWREPSAGLRGDAGDPATRARMAEGLQRQIDVCRHRDPAPFIGPRLFGNGEWQLPHGRLFAELPLDPSSVWIDELAEAADAVLASGPELPVVIGHGDWRANQVVVVDGRLDVVYDWESLQARPEAELVGCAAVGHQLRPTAPPDVAAARGFMADYEVARGRAFTNVERSRAGAAALLLVAFCARAAHRRSSGAALAALRCAATDWLEL